MAIISIGAIANQEVALNFGTHNGIFHCDEVVGIAVLELANIENDAHVARTRDLRELEKMDIVIDIGGGMFDHHMAGFDVCRPTGEKYASAGLVWREFATKAIKNVAKDNGVPISDNEILEIKEQIDKEIIIPVDLEDNGTITSHIFSFIPAFRPSFLEPQDFDTTFINVERIVFEVLRQIIKNKVVQVATKPYLQERFKFVENSILEVSAQTVDWLEETVKYNETHNFSIKFVMFPYPAGGWAVQCVPPSIEKKFDQLIPFPKEWAGGNEKTLPEISGIQDATFCQNGRFFARAKTRQAIIEMCKIAMS